MAAEDEKQVGGYPLSADRPIQTRDEDRLGRRGFAEGLARGLGEWRGKDSLVIALYGAWGSGKSSVKNMALEALAQAPQSREATVVEFNPWEYVKGDVAR